MYAYECVDDGRWQAYRQQLKRADGSICPGRPLYDAALIEALSHDREVMREALENIRIEAERENGRWNHLKRVIAINARAALASLKGGAE
jgi:hypothetical protein